MLWKGRERGYDLAQQDDKAVVLRGKEDKNAEELDLTGREMMKTDGGDASRPPG